MATLRERLTQIFPKVLPQSPDEAINGTELLRLVLPELGTKYSESSVRAHFSLMASEPDTPIAKVDQGHGYYLRTSSSAVSIEPVIGKHATRRDDTQVAEDIYAREGRTTQLEEKFRSIFIRQAELNNHFPMFIEHTKGTKRQAGINKWKFPDVIVLEWQVGEVTDTGFKLVRDMLEVKKSLGEQPFKLNSVELKVELIPATFRENFFQCVSNSKWAHTAQLVVACPVSDTLLADELRRLGTSYDVTIITYGLDIASLENLPSAETILTMTDSAFDSIASRIKISRVASGRDRQTLDWEHIRDLRNQSDDFGYLFQWISYCLEKKKPYTYKEYEQVAKVESKYT